MNGSQPAGTEQPFHEQELRIALVMNGGVSLAVWIGGVSQEINRLVRGESVYGLLCEALSLHPRVDIISGTSAGGINGALLALAMSQGKPLDPIRDIWLAKGDILTLLREPTQSDPPSLLDGDYFYQAMAEGFRKIRDQPGAGLQPAGKVPIELTLTTTVLHGDVKNFPDDVGTVIRDITHRGLIRFRRGADMPDDPFSEPQITAKLAVAARATASFPGAFQPFYLPAVDEDIQVDGESVPCLVRHTNFNQAWEQGRFVVDGGVLDNSPLESAIEAVFRQRAEGEVRRVLAYVVPDPGQIPDPPPQQSAQIPTLVNTVLASLVSIPRVESVSAQLRAITEHNRKVSRQRDTRLVVAQSLSWEGAERVAEAVFTAYRQRRADSSVEHIVDSLAQGAARHEDATAQGVALGRRARERIARTLSLLAEVPWLPPEFDFSGTTKEWHWGLFTLENVMALVLDLLRRGVKLAPARRLEATAGIWQELRQSRRRAFDLVNDLAKLRRLDLGHWLKRGKILAPKLAILELEKGIDTARLNGILRDEIRQWVRNLDPDFSDNEPIRPPRKFTELALSIGELFMDAVVVLRGVLELGRQERWAARHEELATLLDFFAPPGSAGSVENAWRRLLTMEIVQYAFGAEATRDQYLELIQFSANVPTAFGGPDRLEQKLAGVQLAHFGAFYKRCWRINDWLFGRLDGADRIVRILLDPGRLARLYGTDPDAAAAPAEITGAETVLQRLHDIVMADLAQETDATYLQHRWDQRLAAMRQELAFLDNQDELPEQLPQCAAMVLERLHLEILRQELPVLADAVGDDVLDGAHPSSNGPKFLKRFRSLLCAESSKTIGRDRDPASIAPQLSADQLAQLFKSAKVGEEKILEEVGTDRFTRTVTRSAAVLVSALAGKGSGFKWLRGAFATVRAPLIAMDILVAALMKKGTVFVSIYAMAMAAAATILLAGEAAWSDSVQTAAAWILAIGFAALLRRHLWLLLTGAVLVLFFWQVLPLIRACIGS